MIDPKAAKSWVQTYDKKNIRLGVTGSHSALDVCDGAADEKLPNVVFAQRGRDATYSKYFRAVLDDKGNRLRGCVDQIVRVKHFADQLTPRLQAWMRKNNVLYVPNRSFTSYGDLDAIETEFQIPIFGSRNLLRIEEREEKGNYYALLKKAGLAAPERIADPKDIREPPSSNCITQERDWSAASSRAQAPSNSRKNPRLSCRRV